MKNELMQRPTGRLVRRAKLRNPLGVPETALRPIAPRQQRYQPAVNPKWLDERWEIAGITMALGGVVDFIGLLGTGIATVPVWSSGPEAVGILLGVVGAAQAFWLVPTAMMIQYTSAKRRNLRAFLQWAQARYGIQLSAEQGVGNFTNAKSKPGSTLTFTDARGEFFKLHDTSEGYYIATGSEGTVEHALTPGAATPTSRVETVKNLPRGLAQAHGRVQELLNLLCQRELSPESDHVLNRAQRDSDKVLELYLGLVKMSSTSKTQETNVLSVLEQLTAELDEVLQRETEWAIKSLMVESNYVKARRQPEGIKLGK